MNDIQLIQFPNTTTDNVAYVSCPVNVGHVTGQDWLLQRIIKRILTVKGSNSFEPTYGSTFHKILGGVQTYDEEVVKTYLNISVKELVNDLILEQEALEDDGATLASEEKLVGMSIRSISYDSLNNKWVLALDVIIESNQVIKLQVPITV